MNLWISSPHAVAGRGDRRRPASSATDIRRIICTLLLNQLPERPQIARVPRMDVAAAAALGRFELGCLEEHRMRREPRIVEEQAERTEAETPFADVLVPIHAAAARLL